MTTARPSAGARLAARAGGRARFAIAAAVALAFWLAVRGHDGYDLAYALLWGDALAHGSLPDLRSPYAPTPHPLANALGALVAPFGRPLSADLFRLVTVLALGAVGVAAFDLGRRLFGAGAGVLAALVLVTRPALVAGALRGSIDIPALALTLFALNALLGERRHWHRALVLLALAGLLRPEAWLLSLAVVAWSRRASLLPLALAAPVLWCAADLIVTGDPLFSFTGTRALAEELNRPRSAPLAPLLVPRLLVSVLGLGVLLAGAAALVELSDRPTPRFRAVLAVLLLALATFVALGVAGLPLLARYLLTPAALLTILAAGVVVNGSRPPLRIVTAVCLLAALPATVAGVTDAVRESRERRALQADLRTLDLAGACAPLSAVIYRHVPVIAYAADVPPAAVHPQPDGATIVLPRSRRAFESLQSAGDGAELLVQPPAGYRLAGESRDWALVTSRPAACSSGS